MSCCRSLIPAVLVASAMATHCGGETVRDVGIHQRSPDASFAGESGGECNSSEGGSNTCRPDAQVQDVLTPCPDPLTINPGVDCEGDGKCPASFTCGDGNHGTGTCACSDGKWSCPTPNCQGSDICLVGGSCSPVGSSCVIKSAGPCDTSEQLACSSSGTFTSLGFLCAPSQTCKYADTDAGGACSKSCDCRNQFLVCTGDCVDPGH